ncbi:MAG: 5'/3'-nucleotidase SurE [Anaerolineaceae bacterium]
MRILVTNDDGVNAPGLLALVQALRKLDSAEITVLAPDHNWSAAGHVKTMHRPLRLSATQLADGSSAWKSDGAPSDCVALAMMGALEMEFDLVVSGINPNANIGLDVTYSGTVTAAMEASIWAKPGIAVSLDAPEFHEGPLDYRSAAEIAAQLTGKLFPFGNGGLPAPIYNINVPYRPEGDYAGVMVTRQGVRIYRDQLVKRLDPRGRPYYWIGGEAPTGKLEDGTDFGMLQQGYVSVTPLQLDMTDYQRRENLEGIGLNDL